MRKFGGKTGFGGDQRGQVAMLMGLMITPLAMGVGAAVDLTRQGASHTHLQAASDAAALAAARAYLTADARSAKGRLESAQATADRWMEQALESESRAVLNASWTLKADAGGLVLKARAESPTAFGGLFGVRTLAIAAESAVATEVGRREVALVLDSTGSMAGSKMASLKKASTRFVDQLEKAAQANPTPDAIKISLVPYANAVNVGPRYADADWMDTQGRSSTHYENLSFVEEGKDLAPIAAGGWSNGRKAPTRQQLFKAMNTAWAGCVESRPYPYDVTDAAPSSSDPDTLYVPYFAPDEPDERANVSGVRRNDYLADGALPKDAERDWFKRQQNILKYAGKPNGAGPNHDCNVAPIVRLTTDTGSVKRGISAMQARGNTNIYEGLHWGWNTISNQGPFPDGDAYGADDLAKVIVLMTDGENVHERVGNPNGSPYAAVGYAFNRLLKSAGSSASERRTAMDKKLLELCRNAKAKDVVIFTIAVEINDDAAEVMKTCASGPDHYKNVKDAGQLNDVFDEIARAVVEPRLTR